MTSTTASTPAMMMCASGVPQCLIPMRTLDPRQHSHALQQFSMHNLRRGHAQASRHVTFDVKAQGSDGESSPAGGRANGDGLLAGVAEEAVRTDDWWGQLGDRSIQDQLLSDLRKNGAPV